ncbi:MAG: hypothetical protein U5Q44_05320 [Dehalococcoidia bacterium]|nr:hypothetical protein [Dehalococcoidia bacterium]
MADEFAHWFTTVHLRDVRRIPGFTTIEYGQTPSGAWLGFYTFESADSVNETLSSPEAAYSRGTWEQWAMALEELVVEMLVPVPPVSLGTRNN